jgi:hypothetical protein
LKVRKFKYVAVTFAILQGVLLGAYALCNNTKHCNNQLKELSISLNDLVLTCNSEAEVVLLAELNPNQCSETPFNLIRVISYKPEEDYRMLISAEKANCSIDQPIANCKGNRYSTPKIDLSNCRTSLLKQFRI